MPTPSSRRHPPSPAGTLLALALGLATLAPGCGQAPATNEPEHPMATTAPVAGPALRPDDHFAGAELDLARAAAAGDTRRVRSLVEAGTNPGAVSRQGMPLLLWPLREGRVDGVRALLDAGAPVDVRDGHGNTPLVWAIRAGHAPVATLLVDRGADVDARDASGEPVLKMAVARGQWSVADRLLDAGADIDATAVDGAPWTALASVASAGLYEQAYHLLERGADPAIALAGGPFPDRVGALPILEALHHTPVCPDSEQARWKQRVVALLDSQGHTKPPMPQRYRDTPPLRC
ncbi:MAG: ankyrin repeat domain-containing protein [Lysobacteraceae bacterium]